MASFVKFESFSEELAEGTHNFEAAGDTLKIVLTNSAPTAATDTVLADITQISSGNGYTTGGEDVQNDTSRTGGVTSVTGVDVVWTSVTGDMGPFRYVVLYNDTPTSPADPLIGYYDYGSAVTLDGTAGETFTVDFSTSIFTIT